MRYRVILLLIAGVFLLSLPYGCGKKAPPQPPDEALALAPVTASLK